MADITNLLNKTENEGTTDSGRLTAGEWNKLVQAVIDNQQAVTGAIKGVKFNGTEYKNVLANGLLEMNVASTSGRNTKFEWIKSPMTPVVNNIISKGASCIVEFNVIDQIPSDADASVFVPYYNPGTVNFYVGSKLVGTINNVYSPDSDKYSGKITFDFSKATTLSTSANGNELKIEYVNSGVTIDQIFIVTVLDISITANNVKTVYTNTDKPKFNITVRGGNSNEQFNIFAEVDDIKLAVDGDGNIEHIGTTYNGVPFEIKEQLDVNPFNTHNVHNIKIWASPVSNQNVITEVLEYNYIYADGTTITPIVMSNITKNSEFEIYGKLKLDYTAYLLNSQTEQGVKISIKNNDDTILLSTEQKVLFNNGIGVGTYTFTLFPQDNSEIDNFIGTDKKLVISIESNGVEYKHETNIIIKSSSIVLNDVKGYYTYLSAMGRSNAEGANAQIWSSIATDSTRAVTTAEFEGVEFSDNGSGWIADANGDTALHLRKGKYFTLKHEEEGTTSNIFKQNPTFNSGENGGNNSGLTVSIEFATRNCINANATIIDCLYEGKGFTITASEAKLLANNISLGAKFREDTRIKIDFVIEGKQTAYKYDTVVGTDPDADDYIQQGTSNECLALIFVDGVYAGLTLVKNDTTFAQGSNAKNIRFGSDECDLDIYSIRIYKRALTIEEIVRNYSYDTPNLVEKIEIARRNDIFSKADNNMPVIDPGKLREARPELPFFYVTLNPTSTNILPQNKSDWKLLSLTSFINPLENSGDKTKAKASFESITGVLRNQGTSSMTYPWPWRNWDWKTGDSEFGNKETFLFYFPNYEENIAENRKASKWFQYDYSGTGNNLAIKKITLKKDYASSEMCNNAICSEIFTDMALGLKSDSEMTSILSPAMKNDITTSGNTDLRLSLKAMPSFMFHVLPTTSEEGTAGTGLNGLGMMNIIPNKNEVGYLGFTSNKWEDKESDKREQSWELCDNLDDVFWVKKLNHFTRNTDNTFINDVKDKYEARTPKDSSVFDDTDFGMVPKGQSTITEQSIADKVYDEQYDIVQFHNWLVDCNQHLATGNELTVNEPWNNGKYTTDSKEYRRAKFTNEAPNRLLLDQWILYYVWREQFWMFDSGFKNLQVYTVGKADQSDVMQWGCMVRDADTALGIENTGKDYFPPHIEDIDYYTESNGVITFHYNSAKDIYDITELKAKYGDTANAVLNGQFGSIWINLRDCFPERIAKMYRKLLNNASQTNFSANAAINKFRQHQEKWCESLYNFGMRQYFGGSPFSYFNTSGLGDKKNSRAQWLERGFYYRRSKYRALSDSSAFRINSYSSPDHNTTDLNIKAYIPMYIGCGGTTSSMEDSKNVIRLIPDSEGIIRKQISIGEDGFNFPQTGDAVSYIYGTSMITDIGDLAKVCKILRVQTLDFPKLREFNLGHEKDRTSVCGVACEAGTDYYENAPIYKEATEADIANGNYIVIDGVKYYVNSDGDRVIISNAGGRQVFKNEILSKLDCTSMKQLTVLDVTNHTNLSELIINECDQLQELYTKGTILKSIQLPATTSLKTVYLGNKLTALKLVGLTGITKLSIESNTLNDCERLEISNCGTYISEYSYDIMKMAINKLKDKYTANSESYDDSNRICTLKNINWKNVETSYLEDLLSINANLTGTIELAASERLTNDLKVRLVEKYNNIDNPENDLYINYTKTKIDSVYIPNKMYFYTIGEHELTFTVKPTAANTFKEAIWSLEGASEYAEIVDGNKINIKQVANDNSVSAKLTLTVKQINNFPDIKAESTVYFYERIAKPGDIVYQDGTFSDEIETGKTPVGVCFYVDPNNTENRLMCALNSLTTDSWGLTYNSTDENWVSASKYINFNAEYNEETPRVDESVYDIQKLYNISNLADNTDGQNLNDYWSNDKYRDDTKSDKFKRFSLSTILGNLGWITIGSKEYGSIEFDLITDGIIRDDNGKYRTPETVLNNGDSVPMGYYNTLAIIEHRNKLLSAYRWSEFGDNGNRFKIPQTYGEQQTELSNLNGLLTAAEKWDYADRVYVDKGTKASLFYYAAASSCYAYEPTATNLIDKFKKHNWFLPSSGEMCRILYYYNWYNKTNNDYTDANAFASAINNNILSRFTSDYYTSTEKNYSSAIKVSISQVNNGKYSGSPVIPVCRF